MYMYVAVAQMAKKFSDVENRLKIDTVNGAFYVDIHCMY
jgi:hypothetical protein